MFGGTWNQISFTCWTLFVSTTLSKFFFFCQQFWWLNCLTKRNEWLLCMTHNRKMESKIWNKGMHGVFYGIPSYKNHRSIRLVPLQREPWNVLGWPLSLIFQRTWGMLLGSPCNYWWVVEPTTAAHNSHSHHFCVYLFVFVPFSSSLWWWWRDEDKQTCLFQFSSKRKKRGKKPQLHLYKL